MSTAPAGPPGQGATGQAIATNGATPANGMVATVNGSTEPSTPTDGTAMAFRHTRRAIGGVVADASTPPTARRGASNGYAEDHSALTWPLLTTGLYAPALAIALFIAALIVQAPALYWSAFGILLVTVAAWVVTSASFLQYFWPLGIRLNADGLRIGGVRWAERHPGRTRASKATVPKQYSQVFGCP